MERSELPWVSAARQCFLHSSMAAPVDWTYPVEPPGWLSRQKHKKHLTASCAKAKKRTSRKLDGSLLLKGIYAKCLKRYFSRPSAFECVFNTCRSFGAWTLAVPDLALRGILWITWLGPGESTSISTRALYSSAKPSSSVNQELLRIGLFLYPDIFLFALEFADYLTMLCTSEGAWSEPTP